MKKAGGKMKDYTGITEKCKGCGLCQNICPKGCIALEYDVEGFLTPVIDTTCCAKCGLCFERCIAEKVYLESSADSILYCAQSFDSENLLNCTSGGFFGELAKVVIERYSGVVYGAIYENAYSVKHARGETLQDTLPMHYSKYVQSDTSGIYQAVKKDLQDGRMVLFTGTPCQIVALKCFLNKEYSNLLCMDILCHGVMSTYVLRDYIHYVLPEEKEYENLEVCFRSKRIAESNSSFTISKNGKILYHEPFYNTKEGIGRAFGGTFANRASCTECEFREIGRYSDITVGDYVKENGPNDLAHSLVLINTKKGQRVFEQLDMEKQLLTDEERNFALERVNRTVSRNKWRKRFFKMYLKQGINDASVTLWKKKTSLLWQRICAKCYKVLKRK